MSLKAFHIVFIIASVALSVGFGVWAVSHYVTGDGSTGEMVLGILSLLLAVGLLWYGKYFLRKLKHISYL